MTYASDEKPNSKCLLKEIIKLVKGVGPQSSNSATHILSAKVALF